MTPLEIEILLHYYCVGNEDFKNLDAPAVETAIKKFVLLGLICEATETEQETHGIKFYGDKRALKVYAEALGEVPLPKNIWVMPCTTPQQPRS